MGVFHALLSWSAWAAAGVAPAVAWTLREPPRLAHVALGWLGGVGAFPLVVGLVVLVGHTLGLEPGAARPAVSEPLLFAWGVALAPLLEEGLYRGWLLSALAPRVGRLAAVAFSSVCFALPHGGPWDLLATFLVGLGLGSVFLATRSLGLCVGLHAGLNTAGLLRGVP